MAKLLNKSDKDNFIISLQSYSKDKILENAKNIKDLSEDVVFKHYSYLLEFTKMNINRNNITELIGLIHMCYGWMPTMYKKSDFTLYEKDKLISEMWKNIKEGSLDEDFLKNLIKITNNSIRGGSKLLHFCNPDMYAIYDTRVFNSINKRKSSDATVNNINYFIQYINKLRELNNDKAFIGKLKNILVKENQVISLFSNLRCIEMCFFYNRHAL